MLNELETAGMVVRADRGYQSNAPEDLYKGRTRLDRARNRPGIEWTGGTAADARWKADFDLATMTGHAFQCLITR